MPVLDRTARWTTAVGLVLVPLLFLLLPSLLPGAEFTSPEEQYRAFAAGLDMTAGFALQVSGSVALLLTAAAGLVVLAPRRRGAVVGAVAAVLGAAGSIVLLLLLGVELAGRHVLTTLDDVDLAVATMVDLSESSTYAVLLLGGLLAILLFPPVLALGLWRARIVPLALPLLFLLPLAVGFLPLPAALAEVLPTALLVLTCAWAALLLVRARAAGPAAAPAGALPAAGVPG